MTLTRMAGDPDFADAGAEPAKASTIAVPIGKNVVTSRRDVTARHTTEMQLRASEERFRGAVESMHDAFTIFSPVRDDTGEIVDFRYEYVNEAYCAMVGFNRRQLVSRGCSEVFPRFPHSARFAMYRQVALTGEPCRHEDVVDIEQWVGTQVPPRRREISAVRIGENLACCGRDVTARYAAERRIRELNEGLARRALDLESANEELESFAHSVAHDLRGPLRAIAGFAGMLRRRGHIAEGDDAGHAVTDQIVNAATSMGEVIDALLELSHLSYCELTIARVDVSALAREIAGQLRCADPERRVEFVIEAGLEVDADHRLVLIALRSLLENAWKYSSVRSPARIEVARAADRSFVVRDNGAGFDMAFADQLFRPFGRLHREDEFPGKGVGLVAAERIVRRHGGGLRGEGRVGHGAAFYFTLAPDQAAPA